MTSYSGLHTFLKFLLFSRRFIKILRLRHFTTDLHETSHDYTRTYSTSTDDARFLNSEFHEVIIRVANFDEIQKTDASGVIALLMATWAVGICRAICSCHFNIFLYLIFFSKTFYHLEVFYHAELTQQKSVLNR